MAKNGSYLIMVKTKEEKNMPYITVESGALSDEQKEKWHLTGEVRHYYVCMEIKTGEIVSAE